MSEFVELTKKQAGKEQKKVDHQIEYSKTSMSPTSSDSNLLTNISQRQQYQLCRTFTVFPQYKFGANTSTETVQDISVHYDKNDAANNNEIGETFADDLLCTNTQINRSNMSADNVVVQLREDEDRKEIETQQEKIDTDEDSKDNSGTVVTESLDGTSKANIEVEMSTEETEQLLAGEPVEMQEKITDDKVSQLLFEVSKKPYRISFINTTYLHINPKERNEINFRLFELRCGKKFSNMMNTWQSGQFLDSMVQTGDWLINDGEIGRINLFSLDAMLNRRGENWNVDVQPYFNLASMMLRTKINIDDKSAMAEMSTEFLQAGLDVRIRFYEMNMKFGVKGWIGGLKGKAYINVPSFDGEAKFEPIDSGFFITFGMDIK